VVTTVKQIHYTGWPDHGIPKKEQFDDFDKLVENSIECYDAFKESEDNKRILLHCSAGIGRTGTLLSIMHIVSTIKNMQKDGETLNNISVFSTVRKLREHRFHLVQSESQYIFIYQYLAAFLKKISIL
jgi:protein tyrosine phosphatase